eukprot:232398-Pelagomonas_calceolata.AAC.3
MARAWLVRCGCNTLLPHTRNTTHGQRLGVLASMPGKVQRSSAVSPTWPLPAVGASVEQCGTCRASSKHAHTSMHEAPTEP